MPRSGYLLLNSFQSTESPQSRMEILASKNSSTSGRVYADDNNTRDVTLHRPTSMLNHTTKGVAKEDFKSRLVDPSGSSNVHRSFAVDGCLRRYLIDAMTSLAELPLCYHVLGFFVVLFGSWTIFGLLWWLMAAAHGDLLSDEEFHLVEKLGYLRRLDTMCTFEVYDFASALLYSVEAQTTLGYGSHVSNPHCSQSLVLFIIQMLVGLAIDGVIAGLLIDKLTRQRRRGRSVEFGRRAVIFRSSQDGSYLLGIRIFYRGKSPLLSASVKAVFVCSFDTFKNTENDDVIPTSLDIPLDESDFAVFPWPETVIHRIDSSSPLWNISAENLEKSNFELIVTVDGTVESTGVSCQCMTSYKASEISWGHVFTPLVMEQRDVMPLCFRSPLRCFSCWNRGMTSRETRWSLNCSQFDELVECSSMPYFSASHNDALQRSKL